MSPPGLSGSQGAVEGALDDLLLLLSGQAVEVDRVARDTDGETGIFLRVFHGVLHGQCAEISDCSDRGYSQRV